MLLYQLLPGVAPSVSDDCCNAAMRVWKERSELDPKATDQEIVGYLYILARHHAAIDKGFKPQKLRLLILFEGKSNLRFFEVLHQLNTLTELSLIVIRDFTARSFDIPESLEALHDS